MPERIRRWGSGLAVPIPKALADRLGLAEGTAVELAAAGGRLVVTPAGQDYDLAASVEGITGENRHGETDWAPPRGLEATLEEWLSPEDEEAYRDL